MGNSLAIAEEVCTGNGFSPSMVLIGNILSVTEDDCCENGFMTSMVLNWEW